MTRKTGSIGRATYKAHGKRTDAQAAAAIADAYARWLRAHGYTTLGLSDAICETLNMIFAATSISCPTDAWLLEFERRAQALVDETQRGIERTVEALARVAE